MTEFDIKCDESKKYYDDCFGELSPIYDCDQLIFNCQYLYDKFVANRM